MVFLAVVIGSGTWGRAFSLFKAGVFALEHTVVFKVFKFSLISMFLLNLFDNIVVLKFIVRNLGLLEPDFANTKAWLIDD